MNVPDTSFLPVVATVGPDGGEVRDRVYLFTDIVGSTAYKSRHGERGARKAILEHDRLFRGLLEASGGKLNKDTGDGFLAVFEEPVAAAALALAFQAGLAAGGLGDAIRVRIALNQGEAYFHPDPKLPGGEKLIGLAVDQTAHLMELAQPGQILLTREVFDAARAGWTGRPAGWFALGERALKPGGEPFEIFEVESADAAGGRASEAAAGGSPAPAHPTDLILGWRPSAGAPCEGRPGWTLAARLGRGSVGEVWEAVETATGRRRAFKFCFSESRVRRLRREWELFQFIERELGVRADIIHPTRLELDRPPFHMEMELAERGDLAGWLARNPNLDRAARLELIIGAAEALDAAHSVGVIHGDIKPHNILILGRDAEAARPALADFGIGKIILTEGGRADVNQSLVFTDHGTNAAIIGTRTYMAPELIAGGRLSIHSDIYSLGVVIYQTLLGDCASPVAEGWQRRVDDPLLCEDIARAIDLDPARRFGSARELAGSLRNLEARRLTQTLEAEERRKEERNARARKLLSASLLFMTTISFFFAWVTRGERARATRETELRTRAESSELRALSSLQQGEFDRYAAQLTLGASFYKLHDALSAKENLLQTPPARRGWEWGALMARVAPEILDLYVDGVNCRKAVMSPDGAWIVSIADDGAARVWDGRTGLPAARCRGHELRLLDVAFLPGGRGFVVAGDDVEASAWDFQGRPLFRLKGHGGPINRVDVDERSNRILTASDDGTARLWSAADGAPLATLAGHSDWVNEARFDPSGRWIATASDDGTARVWSAETGAEAFVLRGHAGPVNALAFQPKGDLLATVSDDTTTRVWNLVKNGECERVLDERKKSVRLVKWIDDEQLVTTELGQQIEVWNLNVGDKPKLISNHRLDPRALAWSDQDGGFLALGGTDGVLRIWDRERDFVAEHPISSRSITSVQFLPSPKRIMVSTEDGHVKVISWAGPRLFDERLAGPKSIAAFTPDGRLIFANFDHTLGVFDAQTRDLATAVPHDSNVRALEATPDGASFAAAYEDGAALLLDSRDLSLKAELTGHTAVVRCMKATPDGRLLTGSEDGRTRLWDWRNGAELGILAERGNWVVAVGFLSSGEAAAVYRDRVVMIFPDGAAPKLVPLKLDSDTSARVVAAEFSPDGERVAVITTAEGGVWRTRDGSRISRLERSFGETALEIVFLPMGESLAVVSGESTPLVFDAASGRLLIPLDWIGTFDVHQMPVREADGQYAFIGESGNFLFGPPVIPPGAFAGATDTEGQEATLREVIRKLRFSETGR